MPPSWPRLRLSYPPLRDVSPGKRPLRLQRRAAAAVNASAAPPADPGPPAPEATPAEPATDPQIVAADANATYASGEYAIGADADAYDDNDPSALTDFRSALDSHGAWVDDPTYGTVWVPAPAEVGADFRPYVTAGHWAYDDDYVWVSDYSWGWAPFHYGRWVFAEGRGWVWIPGREYRGAWVTWSVDDGYGYLGWAPMGPAFLWFGGVPVGWHGYWGPRWAYVPARGGLCAAGRRAGRRWTRRCDRRGADAALRGRQRALLRRPAARALWLCSGAGSARDRRRGGERDARPAVRSAVDGAPRRRQRADPIRGTTSRYQPVDALRGAADAERSPDALTRVRRSSLAHLRPRARLDPAARIGTWPGTLESFPSARRDGRRARSGAASHPCASASHRRLDRRPRRRRPSSLSATS